ncbi:MAG: transporter, partial [Tardiphaga sp.]|nr:transporter [Tardiphaga sp.]
ASYAGGTASLDDALAATIAVAEARLDLLTRQAGVVRGAVRINLTYRSDDQ